MQILYQWIEVGVLDDVVSTGCTHSTRKYIKCVYYM